MEAGVRREPGEGERATILSCQRPPHSHDVPMGRILVRVVQLRKGAGGRTLLVVEGSFRKRPEAASALARAAPTRANLNFPLRPHGRAQKTAAIVFSIPERTPAVVPASMTLRNRFWRPLHVPPPIHLDIPSAFITSLYTRTPSVRHLLQDNLQGCIPSNPGSFILSSQHDRLRWNDGGCERLLM